MAFLRRNWIRRLHLARKTVDRFHHSVVTPIVTENHASPLPKERGRDLQGHTIHLPLRKTTLCTVVALRNRKPNGQPCKWTRDRVHSVAASVFGVTSRALGAYAAMSARAAS